MVGLAPSFFVAIGKSDGYSKAKSDEDVCFDTYSASNPNCWWGYTGWELTFEVPDHTVVVRGSGEILIGDDVIYEASPPA